MRSPHSRRGVWQVVIYCVIVAAAIVAVRNATVYPAIAGYDAQEAIDYARGIVRDGRLPEGTGSYYTPPGFFAVGGLGIDFGERLGLDHPERVGQVVNAFAAVGTMLLLLVLVRLLWPGREALHLAAVVFFAVCPVVMKSAAMFHPEPLSMLLSTAALVLAARLLVRSDYRLRVAASLGLMLGLAQLIRAWTLWTVAVVILVLVVATVTRPLDRRPSLRVLGVVAAVAILVPAPWYAHQVGRYDSALFGQPHPAEPVWTRRPAGFFVGAGLPQVVTEPYRPSFSRQFLPIAFTETWGDYFGVWRWFPHGDPPSAGVRRELVTMSVVGLPLTLVALAGWIALLGLAVRHPGRSTERLLVTLLPLAALAGVLYFATAYPTPDGDTVKGSFMLIAGPRLGRVLRLRVRRAPVAVPTVFARVPGRPRSTRSRREPVPPRRRRALTERRATDEWRYLRAGCVVVAALVAAELAGWVVYRSVRDAPTALELTEKCLRREKLLPIEPIVGDPVALTAGGGALATRVLGNGVHVVIAKSDEEAARLVATYLSTAGRNIKIRLDERGRVIYVWEAVRAPHSIERQTVYDCWYE